MKQLNSIAGYLLNQLTNEKFISGADMAEALSVSRTAIWKQIKNLQMLGYQFESRSKTGYRLMFPVDPITPARLIKALDGILKPEQISSFVQIDSTNEYLKHLSQPFPEQIHVCIAEQQLSGRGRLGRTWVSPFGYNIYLSMSYSLTTQFKALSGLSLVIGLAILDAFDNYGLRREDFSVKWPNDIYEKKTGKKCAGILVELQMEANGQARAIIGIGLNVNMPLELLSEQWQSLAVNSGVPMNRLRLIACLVESLKSNLAIFEQSGFSSFLKRWHAHDYLYDKDIQLTTPSGLVSGRCIGIDKNGSILVKTEANDVHGFIVGEASLQAKS